MRVKGTNTTRIRRKKYIKLAKGYRGQRSINFKVAKQQVYKSYLYAYRDRKNRKRDFRKLWIARINAAARMNGISYSKFMSGLKNAQINLNRKMLADLAISDFKAFSSLVDQAKNALNTPVPKRNAATLEKDVHVDRVDNNEVIKINVAGKANQADSSKKEVAKETKTTAATATVEKPTSKSTVAEIKSYLTQNNIEFSSSAKKDELLTLVK